MQRSSGTNTRTGSHPTGRAGPPPEATTLGSTALTLTLQEDNPMIDETQAATSPNRRLDIPALLAQLTLEEKASLLDGSDISILSHSSPCLRPSL